MFARYFLPNVLSFKIQLLLIQNNDMWLLLLHANMDAIANLHFVRSLVVMVIITYDY